jgi:hypothetical protein
VPGTPAEAPSPAPQPAGSISGTVVAKTGAPIAGAHVTLTRGNRDAAQETLSGEDGQFSFTSLPPGNFQLAVTATDFAPQAIAGLLHSGEAYTVSPINLALAATVTDLDVVVPREEVAEEEIKEEEKQRILGVIPNFYVSYLHDAAPLSTRQKFELAWKATVDPVTFGLTAAIAGVQQAQNDFSAYGQGAGGYAKRFGAGYGDAVTSTFIGSALLPSLLKQDPRYFYKGSGSPVGSRILYAIANAFICKGDNKQWQPNYSNIVGNLAAGGISNLYYPAADRNGAALTIENGLIGIGASAATNLLEEFVIRRFTPNLPNYEPPKS